MNQFELTIPCYCQSTDALVVKEVPYNKGLFGKKFQKAKILRCRKCRMMRTSPTPLLVDPDFYSVEDVSHSHGKNIELWKNFSLEIMQNILPFKKSGKLLDVGCNIGILVKVAEEHGFSATGIDLNEKAVSFGQIEFGVSLSCTRLETIPGEGIYDVIVMNHVIEHIQDLDSFMVHIKRLLKQDGLFFSACPNAESLVTKTLHLLNLRKNGKGANWFWYGYLPEEHIWQFGPTSLSKVITKSGLEVIKCSAEQNMHWGAIKNPGFRFKMMAMLWWIYKKCNRGDNLFILAKKK